MKANDYENARGEALAFQVVKLASESASEARREERARIVAYLITLARECDEATSDAVSRIAVDIERGAHAEDER